MSRQHEVISAFLDDEPFDSEELVGALSDPAGRALLIDLVALRRIVQPTDSMPAIRCASPVRRPVWRVAAAAAALLSRARRWVSGRRATFLDLIVRSAAANPDRPCSAVRSYWRHVDEDDAGRVVVAVVRGRSRERAERLTKCRFRGRVRSRREWRRKGGGRLVRHRAADDRRANGRCVLHARLRVTYRSRPAETRSRTNATSDGESKSRRRGSSITP